MRRAIWAFLFAVIVTSLVSEQVLASVVIIANRTADKVRFDLATTDGRSKSFTVEAGDLASIPVPGEVRIIYNSRAGRQDFVLAPNSMFYFGAAEGGGIELREIGITRRSSAALPSDTVNASALVPPMPAPRPTGRTIPIKVLIDDDERAAPAAWQDRLRRRVKAVSDILDKHCHLRLEIAAFDTWESKNSVTDFELSLREFERAVNPAPARLAIGFTSQYQITRGRVNLGGTRAPLHPFILIREWSRQISEPERLEVLLHEVGHYLGAVHSPEGNSVMRPLLGDRIARAREFRIGFDPVNTLAMSLLGDEMATREVRTLTDISPPTRALLRDIYQEIAQALPADPAAAKYVELLDRTAPHQQPQALTRPVLPNDR